jgi:3-phenylpropionate/trans-cinnamate dioxygenase ferredoxin subunit
MASFDYDVAVIGSGFGGSVAALRAAEKGYLDDRKVRMAIARVDDRLDAFDDLCTCSDRACLLSGGLLTGKAIMCQRHGSRFDLATGADSNGPATDALEVYEVQEVEGAMQIRA